MTNLELRTPSLGLSQAMDLAHFIMDHASHDGGKPVAICVVDATGKQMCALTMDGTKEPSIYNAFAKAVTAIKFQRDTVEFRHKQYEDHWEPTTDRWSEFDVMQAMHNNSVFCAWAGGTLIYSPYDSNAVIGAVGVSNRDELGDHSLASLRLVC